MKKLTLLFILGICFTKVSAQEELLRKDGVSIIIYTDGTWQYKDFRAVMKDGRDTAGYKVIEISNQIWMAENLAFKTDKGSWAYDNDNNNLSVYGRLYNWETAKRACPSGWHLPSDKEWNTLIEYLGGENVAGGKLKSKSKSWKSPNTGADNNKGFEALPAGYYEPSDKTFSGAGYTSNFWSSSPAGNDGAFNYEVHYYFAKVRKNNNKQGTGYSVRCVKD